LTPGGVANNNGMGTQIVRLDLSIT